MLSNELRDALEAVGVRPTPVDAVKTRDEIVARLASLHPDKIGGEFADDGQRSEFQQVQQVLERFDREVALSTQMIPIQHVSSLVEVLAKAQAMSLANARSNEASAMERFHRLLKRKYALPKITSALVASLCLALITLSGNFKGSPFYRIAVDYYAAEEKAWMTGEIKKRSSKIGRGEYDVAHRVASYNSEYGGRIGWNFRRPERLSDASDVRMSIFIEEYTSPLRPIDLYSTEQTALFKSFEHLNAGLIKDITSRMDHIRTLSPETEGLAKKEIEALSELMREINLVNEEITETRDWLVEAKRATVNKAEWLIHKRLALLTILACGVFLLAWFRERSDESWIAYVSSDEGLEAVVSRLSSDEAINSREPARFTTAEFTEALGTKDVPTLLVPILGRRLDSRHLGQVSASLLAKLKDRNVIADHASPALPAIQTWYEFKVVNLQGR